MIVKQLFFSNITMSGENQTMTLERNRVLLGQTIPLHIEKSDYVEIYNGRNLRKNRMIIVSKRELCAEKLKFPPN